MRTVPERSDRVSLHPTGPTAAKAGHSATQYGGSTSPFLDRFEKRVETSRQGVQTQVKFDPLHASQTAPIPTRGVDKHTPHFTFDVLDADINVVARHSDGQLENARRELWRNVNAWLGGNDEVHTHVFTRRDNRELQRRLEKAGVKVSPLHGNITLPNTREAGVAFAHIVEASFSGGFGDFNFVKLKEKSGLQDDAPFVQGYETLRSRYQTAAAIEGVRLAMSGALALKPRPMLTQVVFQGQSNQGLTTTVTATAQGGRLLDVTVAERYSRGLNKAGTLARTRSPTANEAARTPGKQGLLGVRVKGLRSSTPLMTKVPTFHRQKLPAPDNAPWSPVEGMTGQSILNILGIEPHRPLNVREQRRLQALMRTDTFDRIPTNLGPLVFDRTTHQYALRHDGIRFDALVDLFEAHPTLQIDPTQPVRVLAESLGPQSSMAQEPTPRRGDLDPAEQYYRARETLLRTAQPGNAPDPHAVVLDGASVDVAPALKDLYARAVKINQSPGPVRPSLVDAVLKAPPEVFDAMSLEAQNELVAALAKEGAVRGKAGKAIATVYRAGVVDGYVLAEQKRVYEALGHTLRNAPEVQHARSKWSSATIEERERLLEGIVKRVAEALGLPAMAVRIYDFGPNETSSARFSYERNRIEINAGSGWFGDISRGIGNVIHELEHHRQFFLGLTLPKNKLRPEDQAQTDAFRQNIEAYMDRRNYGTPTYLGQPLEIYAFALQKAFMRGFTAVTGNYVFKQEAAAMTYEQMYNLLKQHDLSGSDSYLLSDSRDRVYAAIRELLQRSGLEQHPGLTTFLKTKFINGRGEAYAFGFRAEARDDGTIVLVHENRRFIIHPDLRTEIQDIPKKGSPGRPHRRPK